MRLTGVDTINLNNCRIYYGEDVLMHLKPFLEKHFEKGDRFFLLTDRNTHQHCQPVLMNFFSHIEDEYILQGGENEKSPENVRKIWDWLLGHNAGREDCLINLGGGVVSDMGGFVASTFKRGMRYINIPTTLIGQADAAIGGKTGINLGGFKNLLGSFYQTSAVFVDPVFLKTLTEDHLRAGYGEIVKCSLLSGEKEWKRVSKNGWDDRTDWVPLIAMALRLKSAMVRKDPDDRGSRRALNFGHTLGHALESLSLSKYPPGLLHGDAIALGMVGELYLSWRKVGLCWDKTVEITRYLKRNFFINPLSSNDTEELLKIIVNDKKNRAGEIRFSLLDDFGKPALDRSCEPAVIQKAMEFVFKERI